MCGFLRRKPEHPKLVEMRRAVAAQDFEALEGLRDHVDGAAVTALAGDWSAGAPWPVKDAIVALVMDQTVAKYPVLRPMMEDALSSPTVETRAYGLCSLTGDWGAFERWLVRGSVDGGRVDEAIGAWRRARG